jgi:hypothetical protein
VERGGRIAIGVGAVVLLGLGSCCAGLAVLPALGVGLVEDPLFGDTSDFDREAQPWVGVDVPIPEGGPLRFERRSAHPFLAEYDRRIRLPARDWVALPMNTGGRTLINVHWHEAEGGGPWIELVERYGRRIVDLGDPTRVQLGWTQGPPSGAGRYLGVIDDREGALAFRAADEAPEAPITPLGE